jgi:metal-sulfur cluster biosynthetic enzyme
VNDERVRQALMQVFDPNSGSTSSTSGSGMRSGADNGDVDIQYSLTTMGCPIGPLIEDQMRAFLAPIDGIGECGRSWCSAAWSPEMMSEEAKAAPRLRQRRYRPAVLLHLQQIEGDAGDPTRCQGLVAAMIPSVVPPRAVS